MRKLSSHTLEKILIIFSGIIVYHNSFNSGWVLDGKEILQILNPNGSTSLKAFMAIESASYIGYFGWFSFYINQFLKINSIWEYHLVNLAIHILCSLSIYELVNLILKTPFFEDKDTSKYKYLALFSALLFVTHPLTTQSVTYLYQRLTSLATLLFLLSINFYIISRINLNKKWSYIFYFLAIITTNLGLYTKHQLVSLPIMLIITEIFFLNKSHEKNIKLKEIFLFTLPFFLSVFLRVIWFDAYLTSFNSTLSETMSKKITSGASYYFPERSVYFFSELNVILTYLRITLLPTNLTFTYDYPYSFTFFNFQTIISFIVLTAIFVYSISTYKKNRLLSFFILWFFINISPTSSIFPERWIIFEHRLYLPAIGLLMVAGLILTSILENIKYNKIAVLLIIIVIFLHSSLTIKRNYTWQNETKLLEDMVKKAPKNIMALSNLAANYMNAKRFNEGEKTFLRVLKIFPSFGFALRGLTNFYVEEKRIEDAISLNEKAFQFSPDNKMFISANLKYLRKALKEKSQ